MATILLSAAGAAIGAGVGGSVLGLSSLVIGRAVGATLGRVIDQRLLGSGAEAVETGKIDRFRLSGASEGAAIAHVYGRMRVAGQIIWGTKFLETSTTSGGGKGSPSQPKVTSYAYSTSLAIALCEGEIRSVGRVWADGEEIEINDLNLRIYHGTADQLPDPKIEAVEGAGKAPAYRGVAYIVIEDLPLERFGNRVPQFSFEAVRPAQAQNRDLAASVCGGTEAVALIPGTGEFSLATTPVYSDSGLGEQGALNVHSPSGKTDFETSLDTLRAEVPNCNSVSLVVSWFGDNLRCGDCTIRPKVEPMGQDGAGMYWTVSGLTRSTAMAIGEIDGEPVYGGTPTDQSVIEAIQNINNAGQDVVFYPFILMEILAGNGLGDPYSSNVDQAVLPWRGRITSEVAPGQPDTTDQTEGLAEEVSRFFGAAQAPEFSAIGDTVAFSGTADWGYRRFILHYAHLCALAGGVSAFCIGSEMRGITQLRDATGAFPTVQALIDLAAEVRTILGPNTKIGYAADWSEYFGYHPQDGTGDVLFNLDPLWADVNIDFVGIDNYMPMSDWRDGEDHADAEFGEIYNLEYLMGNIEGGEGYDWYYAHDNAREAQIRSPIEDGAHEEPWVYRYKDLRSWWSLPHHERVSGARNWVATDWVPRSKPIWFTEIGCAAINKGTNQPNKFLDVKSSESGIPLYSSGYRDDLIQMKYLEALYTYWKDDVRNPYSEVYDGPMIDMSRAHVWAWDARPFPFFPNLSNIWSDGENYARGHWLTGRASIQPLAEVVQEICQRGGLTDVDTSELFGMVRGYVLPNIETARASLQPLMLAYGFEAIERDGKVIFRNRNGRRDFSVDLKQLALDSETDSFTLTRIAQSETIGRVRLNYVEADGDFRARVAETVFADDPALALSQSEFDLAFTSGEARAITERWLAEARIAQDSASFDLPPSASDIGAGHVVEIADASGRARYRVDRVDDGGARKIEAVRVEPAAYSPSEIEDEISISTQYVAAAPVLGLFLDLPLLTGDENEIAPHMAATASPWPGGVNVFSSASSEGFTFNTTVTQSSVIGVTENDLARTQPAIWDQGSRLRVRLAQGALSSASTSAVLNGANVMAIGNSSTGNWEVLQFTTATLIEENTYEVSGLLRGQQGTDGIMPDIWPSGAYVVLMNGTLPQINVASASRDLVRYYRYGPSTRGYDHPSYIEETLAFSGVGLRPYKPAHLQFQIANQDIEISWVRRTRIDGDSWQTADVPLGEGVEAYHLRILRNNALVRQVDLTTPNWVYADADQTQDGTTGTLTIEVAQVSERFGPGPYAGVTIV